MLTAARLEARKRFNQNRREGVDTPMQIQTAIEAAQILRHNIVQGSRDKDAEDGKWGVFFVQFIPHYLFAVASFAHTTLRLTLMYRTSHSWRY